MFEANVTQAVEGSEFDVWKLYCLLQKAMRGMSGRLRRGVGPNMCSDEATKTIPRMTLAVVSVTKDPVITRSRRINSTGSSLKGPRSSRTYWEDPTVQSGTPGRQSGPNKGNWCKEGHRMAAPKE